MEEQLPKREMRILSFQYFQEYIVVVYEFNNQVKVEHIPLEDFKRLDIVDEGNLLKYIL